MSKKTKTSSQSTSTATRTPTNPEWVTSGLESLGGKIMGLANMDPRSFVAGPSALQTKAFGDAGNLTVSPRYAEAGNIFTRIAGEGPSTYTAKTGQAKDWTAQGYDAVTGQATKAGPVADWEGQGYDAATYNASSLLEGLDKYMSPYTNDVVNTALADYDFGAGETRANQALDEARSGAFGGSGAAITRALTEDNLTRGRGTLSAGLRDTAFTRGANLSATDAGFRNDASRFNAGALNDASAFRANAANTAAAANAAARNQFSLADQAALNQFGLANMDAQNRAREFGANATNTASASNAAAANQFGLANMDAENNASQFNSKAVEAALNRQLSAGSALQGLGAQEGADTRANIALQGALGADQRAIEQALAGAPLDVLERIAKTYSGLPLNLLSGETTTGTQTGSSTSKTWDPMGTAGRVINAAGTVATAFSDRRLKTDIERIGEREDGIGVYLFRYLWSPVQHIGVMAQEVLKVKPEAVVHTPSGFMAVDYGAL
jgi:hypothetical protein